MIESIVQIFVTFLIGFLFGWIAARFSLALTSDKEMTAIECARRKMRKLLGLDD